MSKTNTEHLDLHFDAEVLKKTPIHLLDPYRLPETLTYLEALKLKVALKNVENKDFFDPEVIIALNDVIGKTKEALMFDPEKIIINEVIAATADDYGYSMTG